MARGTRHSAMAFTVEDFQDLVRLLEERPEWRAELRRLLLPDEVLRLPAVLQELAERVQQLATAQQRTEQEVASLRESVHALTEAQQQLTEAQQRTEATLQVLI